MITSPDSHHLGGDFSRLFFFFFFFLMMWLEDMSLTFCPELSVTRRVAILAATRTSGEEMAAFFFFLTVSKATGAKGSTPNTRMFIEGYGR